MTRLSVVGLGKLGACSAACFASRGMATLGMDVNPALVEAINRGRAPVSEPRLAELIASTRGRLQATCHYRNVIEESDVTFLVVPTPSRDDGQFSDQFLCDALRELAAALRLSSKPYHLFAVTSTVSPGTTEGRLIPLIEDVSGRRLNRDVGVCYNPEFIALGSVIRDFLNPDLVLIGESDAMAGAMLEEIYHHVCENVPYVARMSIPSAEVTKIGLNSYVTMKISFANTLATICERMPGTDIDAITRALGADRRVSPHGLRAGLPYGGPCFPRDNRAFAGFAEARGAEARLARATDEVNRKHLRHVAELVRECLALADRPAASVVGLAYKPGTPVVEESSAFILVEELIRRGAAVTVYDPLAMENARRFFGERIQYATSIRECTARSPLVVIASPLPEIASIDDSYFPDAHPIIVDCWRVLDPTKFRRPIRYIALGVASELGSMRSMGG